MANDWLFTVVFKNARKCFSSNGALAIQIGFQLGERAAKSSLHATARSVKSTMARFVGIPGLPGDGYFCPGAADIFKSCRCQHLQRPCRRHWMLGIATILVRKRLME